MKTITKICAIFVTVLSAVMIMGADSAKADHSFENSQKLRGGLHAGFSAYTGIIGAEIQKGHFGLTLGIPACLGLRYYFDETGARWFLGAHGMYFNVEEEETKDGIRYDEIDSTLAGAGIGYKWRWNDHWDLTLNLSLAYYKEKYTGDYATRTDEYITVVPGISFGYTF
ncbi:MAG: DUF3575 domain-containing protein [Desulfobacteraceae bacterium]|nr:DUF3575 domain-containing protein [Desulfobacteraceae bacterium]